MRIVGVLAPATLEEHYADDCVISQDVPVTKGGRTIGHTVRVWAKDGSLWAEMEVEDGTDVVGVGYQR